MSDLSVFIKNMEEKCVEMEKTISESLANHHSLIGYYQAVKEIIVVMKPLAASFYPAATPIIEECETMMDAIDSVVTPDSE